MSDKVIEVESFEKLKHKMKTMEFSVQWMVTSDIGPDWIGSSRTIDFYLGDFILSETEFCKKLKDRLIESIPIPNESKDHVITGNGDIILKENQFEICYDWDATIPYQNPGKSKEGRILFFP